MWLRVMLASATQNICAEAVNLVANIHQQSHLPAATSLPTSCSNLLLLLFCTIL
jgi:hypothetical protein